MSELYQLLPFVVARIEDVAGKILLGQHPNLVHKPYPLHWDLPGGKLLPRESPEKGICREVLEETGFEVRRLQLIDVFHHYGTDPVCTNQIPSLGLCYKAAVWGDFVPAEMFEMDFKTPVDIKLLTLTPWARYFLRDLL